MRPRIALILLLAACDTTVSDGSGPWQTSRETRGDTSIVRTHGATPDVALATITPELSIGVLEGNTDYMFGRLSYLAVDADGSIYAYDSRPPLLRKYDAEGRYVATFGGEGDGPGEFRQVTGIAARHGGGVFVWDPRNTRLTELTSDGTILRETRIPSSLFGPQALFADTTRHVWVNAVLDRSAEQGFVTGLLHYDHSGTFVDTVRIPDWNYQPPLLMAESPDGRIRSSGSPAFSPVVEWTLTHAGEMVSGVSSNYRIDIERRDGTVLRIEKDAEPVPVPPQERDARREQTAQSMRRIDPEWRWSGPDSPAVKPFFRNLYPGVDGTLWVRLHAPSAPVPPPPPPEEPPQIPRFTEPTVFDVFAEDGRYLGQVEAPERTTFHVMSAEHVWAVARDSLDVQTIVRFRVEFPARD